MLGRPPPTDDHRAQEDRDLNLPRYTVTEKLWMASQPLDHTIQNFREQTYSLQGLQLMPYEHLLSFAGMTWQVGESLAELQHTVTM